MLANVTVVEIGESLSVAYAGRLLADAGCSVVVLEPATGRTLRSTDRDYSEFLDAGKHSVTTPGTVGEALEGIIHGVDIALCDEADTFATLSQLREVNPALIVVCVTDYGLIGPDAGTPATELTLQAEAGIAVMHVANASPPFVCGVPIAEISGGIHAAIGSVQALLARDAGGAHVDVDVSRLESLMSLLTFPWNWERVDGHASYRLPMEGNAPFIPPMNSIPEICEAKDGWVCISGNTPQQWTEIKRMMSVPGLDDARFDQVATRATYRDEVVPLLESFTRRHTVAELIELATAHRVPVAPVATTATAHLLPPYVQRDSTVPSANGRFRQPRPPIRFGDSTDPWVPSAAPIVGEHDGLRPAAIPSSAPPVSKQSTAAQPLRGMRVVGFEVFHAGPMVTAYLARLGADVVKVEAVNRPDLIRFAGVPAGVELPWERSATFIALNLGKRGITADLSDPAGMEIARRLIATADVVVDSFVPRALGDRGLDYEGVRALRPDVIMTRMPGWGLAGDWASRPAYTQLVEAASGTASLTGRQTDLPRLTGTVFDPMSALFAIFGTLTAIRHRQVTGRGGQVEVALCDSAIQMTARELIQATGGGDLTPRVGNRSAAMAPQGIYRCRDGEWIGLTIEDETRWAALATIPGCQRWASDPRFAQLADRIRHHDEIDAELAKVCANTNAKDLAAALRAAGIAAAPLGVGGELIDHPQIRARGRVFDAPHEVVGSMPYLGPPTRLSTCPTLDDTTGAPLLGHDNLDVLMELGYTTDQITGLAEVGAIGSVPYARPKAASA